MSSNDTITCPECGTKNSAISLFCAECGSSLAHVSATSNSQATSALPISSGSQSTMSSPIQTTSTGSIPAASSGSTLRTNAKTVFPKESRRGLFLGMVAMVLIVALLVLFTWTSVLDNDARNWFTDLV